MLRITLSPAFGRGAADLAALGQRWQALEAESDPGFFRSWTFIGCLAAERFRHASLLSVTQDGSDLALGLLGRTRGRAWLHQSGDRGEDAPFIEPNGLLTRTGHAEVTQPALREAARDAGSLVLSGIGDETLHAARAAGWLDLHQSRFAPSVGLAALGGAYLDTLSANTRAQIRRSQRLYGPELRLSRAESLEQALAYFNELAALHQAAWIGRGKPGAFGAARMRQFHSALIARAWPRGQADLLRIAAGPRPIGLLYNFIRDGKVLSYQSGFAPTGDAREKPGLVCHTLAIEYYAAAGHRCYDLLAGADRYKLSLASGGEMLHWATLHRPRSLSGAASLLKAALRQLKPASSG